MRVIRKMGDLIKGGTSSNGIQNEREKKLLSLEHEVGTTIVQSKKRKGIGAHRLKNPGGNSGGEEVGA